MSDYQMVIQLSADLFGDPAYAELEDQLIEVLDGVADIDGHDIGSGQWNIFIETTRPKETFDLSYKYLLSANLLSHVKVGHRKMDEDDYTCLWPRDCDHFEVI